MKLLLLMYDVFFLLLILLYPAVYLFKRKFSFKSFLEKLSFLSLDCNNGGKCIWIQVVSVGEAFLVKKLISQLSSLADYRLVISTTTLTGNKVANKLYSSKAKVIYFPFDSTPVLKRVIGKINPKVFIAVETEIWPNLFYQLNKRDIPIVVLNGRISDGAFARYKRFRWFIKKALALPSTIGVQNEFYKQRFLSLGVSAQKIIISGNMKFDSLDVTQGEVEKFISRYQSRLKGPGALLLIAASTHWPEESLILDIYRDLKVTLPIRLLIAPRHPARVKEIEKHVHSCGLRSSAIRQLDNSLKSTADEVFILDTVGDLFLFYALADLCFMGGTLVDCGGHNILEPMFFSKPTLFGPFMNNFREIEEEVLHYKAAVKVKDKNELKEKIKNLLQDNKLRQELSRNCVKVFAQEKKNLQKNLEIIKKYL